MDNIFSLVSVVWLKWDKGLSRIYCFFIGFRAAFDRIDRRELFYKLGPTSSYVY